MKKFKNRTLLLFICFSVFQGEIGHCYKNEIDITPAPPAETTTQKSGFFSGFKNFFRGSPTTTTTTTTSSPLVQGSINAQKPPPLTISNAPLMPLGPRPDTPSSSALQQLPQWPQIAPSSTSTSTTKRPQPQRSSLTANDERQGILPNLLGNVGPQQPQIENPQVQRPGSPPNLPPGLTNYGSERPQPSGFDLSNGGGNAAGLLSGNRPGFGPAPLVSSTSTTTTTVKPFKSQQSSGPQQPQQSQMGADLRFDHSTTTERSPIHLKERFPALPSPRRPSTGAQEDFPALPSPKSAGSSPGSLSRPSSPSVGNATPKTLSPSFPTPATTSRSGSPATHGTGNRVSFVPSNGRGTQSGGDKPLATDNEIQQLTETLYTKEVNSQLALIQVNIQGKTRSIDSGDAAPNPLLTVDERALQSPTIAKLRPLFNNYEIDTLVNEYVTPIERGEENEFLDAIMATSVMRQTMLFLQNKGIVTPDPKTHRDLIKELWFTQYSRGSGKVGSSGFEHVFVNEVKNGTIIGLHNWVYFYEEEKAGRLDYKGYMKAENIGTKGKILKARFTHNGLNKPVNTLFIGTSPELELALYTVCFMLRPDRTCPVSLGNTKFGIIAYAWRYRGKNLIGSAYPEI